MLANRRRYWPITLRDVGKRAGVSAMTVSRVINGREGVDAETQRRVEEAIEALDYVPNRIARGLVSQKTADDRPDRARCRQPVLLAGGARRRDDGAQGRLPRAALQQRGRSPARARIYRGPGRAPGRRPAARAGQRPLARRSCLPLLRGSFPLVLLDRALPDIDCDLVVSDSVAGARRLVEHLIARRPSRHRALHRLRRHLDRARAPARLSRGARGGRHRLSRGAGVPHHGRPASAAIAPRSRCWRSIRCRPRSSPSTT